MNVFLSYNRQNQSFVAHVAEQLKLKQFGLSDDLFFDQDNLGPGDDWANKIHKALVNSDACLVFIGEQGLGPWQMKEVLKAISRLEEGEETFRLIPVIVPHSNRDNIHKSFPWFLADTQWIEFTGPSDSEAFLKLVETLRRDAPTPFPIPEGASNPYKGLESFGVDDAAFFFGRTFDVNRVFFDHLRLHELPTGKRFLAVVGNSGSGKSSFVRAGLLAALKAGRFPGSANWVQLVFTPDDQPLLKLAAVLEKGGVIASAADYKDRAAQDPETLRTRLEVHGKRLVLLIDQFEEVITQCKDASVRSAFLNNLTEAVKSDYLVCLITLRSDFYASFAPFREFNDLLRKNNYTLAELDPATGEAEWRRYLRDIIRKPARLLGVEVEPVLATQLVEDVRDIHGVLPALQLALQRLWANRKQENRIASADYDSLAQGRGIAGLIEEHANAVFNRLTRNGTDPDQMALFRAVFIRLVEITGGKDDVRKTISQKNLQAELAYGFNDEQVQKMLRELSGEGSRLIRVKGDGTAEDTQVEVIHEVLIRKWERLRGWVDERREALAYKQRLLNDIGNDLYSGRKLKAAQAWRKTNPDLNDQQTKAFIEKSRHRQNRLVRLLAAAALLVAAWLGVRQTTHYQLTYQLPDEVERIITNHLQPVDKQKALDSLALADPEAARQMAETLPEINKNEVFRFIVTGHARQSQFEEARAVADSLSDEDDKATALRELARAMAQANVKKADYQAVFAQARAVAGSISNAQYQDYALRELAKAMAQAKLFTQARALADSTFSFYEGDEATALIELARAMAQANVKKADYQAVFAQARTVANSISTEGIKADALGELARAMAQANVKKADYQAVFAQARTVADSLSDEDSKATALRELATAMAQAKLFTQARAVANSILVEDSKATALRELVTAMADQHQFREAYRVSQSIPDTQLEKALSLVYLLKSWRASDEKPAPQNPADVPDDGARNSESDDEEPTNTKPEKKPEPKRPEPEPEAKPKPTTGAEVAEKKAEKRDEQPAVEEAATPAKASGGGTAVTHTVGDGQTFYGIANRYNVKWETLKKLNPEVEDDNIKVGVTKLKIPVRAVHTVGPGDILRVVAQKYGVTVDQLMAANGKTKNVATRGEKLIIPYSTKE